MQPAPIQRGMLLEPFLGKERRFVGAVEGEGDPAELGHIVVEDLFGLQCREQRVPKLRQSEVARGHRRCAEVA